AALEGNYNAVPKDPEMPVDTLRKALRGAQVVYAEGAPYADGAPLPVLSTMFRTAATGGPNGLKAEYFNGVEGDIFAGKPAAVRQDSRIDFDWNSLRRPATSSSICGWRTVIHAAMKSVIA
ncbi:MAG: hypothetical protein JF584_19975, partial [Acidobacteria bacterium]|nr:hypothetical protein [Acidobacteriota bacterium]